MSVYNRRHDESTTPASDRRSDRAGHVPGDRAGGSDAADPGRRRARSRRVGGGAGATLRFRNASSYSPPRRPARAARTCCSPGCDGNTVHAFAALVALADCMVMLGSTPTEIAHTVAFLQIDLTDPDFHRHALAASRAPATASARSSRTRSRAGELRRCTAGRSRRRFRRRSTDRCSTGPSIAKARSWPGCGETY